MADDTTPADEPPAAEPKYDQSFFLDLAAKGKDAWNAWRRDPANKDVYVTFRGVDFSEAPRDQINFEGFEFGTAADFSGCKWRGGSFVEIANDPKAFRPGHACFIGATFCVWADFTGAAFGDLANFIDAAFGDYADFAGAAFGNWAKLTGAAFGRKANFTGAAFKYGAEFTGAAFGDGAKFTGAAFGEHADFDDTIFKGSVEFTGRAEEQWTRNLASVPGMEEGARSEVEKQHRDSWARNGSGPDRFLTISFSRTRFDDEASFSDRSFEKSANFTDARFYYPPDLDGAANVARIDFTSAHIDFVSLAARRT